MRRTNGLVCAGVVGLMRACGMGTTTVLAIGAASLTLSGVALADVKPVEPRFMIVTKDGAALRCDTGNIYYPVRTLKAGDLLKIDGEGSGWVRAEYPVGTRAYVRADEGAFDSATKTVKLTKASKLMAANETGARPWWPLLEKDIAAGMTFTPAEIVKAADGSVEGYLIPAPTSARGYVKAEQIRAASAEEAASKATPPPVPVAATPKPIDTKPAEIKPAETKPFDTAVKPIETKPVEVKVAEVVKPVETKPVETKPIETPVVKPIETKPMDVKPVETKPIEAKPVETKPVEIKTAPVEVKPAVTSPVQPKPEIIEMKPVDNRPTAALPTTTPVPTPAATSMPATSPKPIVAKPQVTRRIDDVSVLRDMFEQAMQPGSDDAEIATVISEFNRKIDALPVSGESGKIRAALEQRMEALRIRKEVAEAQRTLRNTGEIDERVRQVHLAVENAQKQAIYAIVGRMLPSTVYDGKRGMPLMYRVESADFSSTRTIGYVIPREGMDFLPVMGKIVGIVGESKMDPALGLNLVMPVRVDEMRVTGGNVEVVPGAIQMPTMAPAPAPAPAGSSEAPATPAPKPAEPETKGQPVASPNTETGEINK